MVFGKVRSKGEQTNSAPRQEQTNSAPTQEQTNSPPKQVKAIGQAKKKLLAVGLMAVVVALVVVIVLTTTSSLDSPSSSTTEEDMYGALQQDWSEDQQCLSLSDLGRFTCSRAMYERRRECISNESKCTNEGVSLLQCIKLCEDDDVCAAVEWNPPDMCYLQQKLGRQNTGRRPAIEGTTECMVGERTEGHCPDPLSRVNCSAIAAARGLKFFEHDDCQAKCDWQCYVDRYVDLKNMFGNYTAAAEWHWGTKGKSEGRNCKCDDDCPPPGCSIKGNEVHWAETSNGDCSDTHSCVCAVHEEPFNKRLSYTFGAFHLAPAGATTCDHGATPSQADCKLAALRLVPNGKRVGRGLQIGSGGPTCDGSWGSVPKGCSLQSGGDWAPHFNTGSGASGGCSSGYSLVCSGSAIDVSSFEALNVFGPIVVERSMDDKVEVQVDWIVPSPSAYRPWMSKGVEVLEGKLSIDLRDITLVPSSASRYNGRAVGLVGGLSTLVLSRNDHDVSLPLITASLLLMGGVVDGRRSTGQEPCPSAKVLIRIPGSACWSMSTMEVARGERATGTLVEDSVCKAETQAVRTAIKRGKSAGNDDEDLKYRNVKLHPAPDLSNRYGEKLTNIDCKDGSVSALCGKVRTALESLGRDTFDDIKAFRGKLAGTFATHSRAIPYGIPTAVRVDKNSISLNVDQGYQAYRKLIFGLETISDKNNGSLRAPNPRVLKLVRRAKDIGTQVAAVPCKAAITVLDSPVNALLDAVCEGSEKHGYVLHDQRHSGCKGECNFLGVSINNTFLEYMYQPDEYDEDIMFQFDVAPRDCVPIMYKIITAGGKAIESVCDETKNLLGGCGIGKFAAKHSSGLANGLKKFLTPVFDFDGIATFRLEQHWIKASFTRDIFNTDWFDLPFEFSIPLEVTFYLPITSMVTNIKPEIRFRFTINEADLEAKSKIVLKYLELAIVDMLGAPVYIQPRVGFQFKLDQPFGGGTDYWQLVAGVGIGKFVPAPQVFVNGKLDILQLVIKAGVALGLPPSLMLEMELEAPVYGAFGIDKFNILNALVQLFFTGGVPTGIQISFIGDLGPIEDVAVSVALNKLVPSKTHFLLRFNEFSLKQLLEFIFPYKVTKWLLKAIPEWLNFKLGETYYAYSLSYQKIALVKGDIDTGAYLEIDAGLTFRSSITFLGVECSISKRIPVLALGLLGGVEVSLAMYCDFTDWRESFLEFFDKMEEVANKIPDRFGWLKKALKTVSSALRNFIEKVFILERIEFEWYLRIPTDGRPVTFNTPSLQVIFKDFTLALPSWEFKLDVVGFFKKLINLIKTKSITWWLSVLGLDVIIQKILGFAAKLYENAKKVFQHVVKFMGSLRNGIKSTLGKVWRGTKLAAGVVSNFANSIAEKVVDGVSSAIELAKEFGNSLVKNIGGIFINIGDFALDLGKDWAKKIKQGLGNAWRGIRKFFGRRLSATRFHQHTAVQAAVTEHLRRRRLFSAPPGIQLRSTSNYHLRRHQCGGIPFVKSAKNKISIAFWNMKSMRPSVECAQACDDNENCEGFSYDVATMKCIFLKFNGLDTNRFIHHAKWCFTKRLTAQPSAWKHCADESEICRCRGIVRYGLGDQWFTTWVSDSVVCNDENFRDPVLGYNKTCECFSDRGGSHILISSLTSMDNKTVLRGIGFTSNLATIVAGVSNVFTALDNDNNELVSREEVESLDEKSFVCRTQSATEAEADINSVQCDPGDVLEPDLICFCPQDVAGMTCKDLALSFGLHNNSFSKEKLPATVIERLESLNCVIEPDWEDGTIATFMEQYDFKSGDVTIPSNILKCSDHNKTLRLLSMSYGVPQGPNVATQGLAFLSYVCHGKFKCDIPLASDGWWTSEKDQDKYLPNENNVKKEGERLVFKDPTIGLKQLTVEYYCVYPAYNPSPSSAFFDGAHDLVENDGKLSFEELLIHMVVPVSEVHGPHGNAMRVAYREYLKYSLRVLGDECEVDGVPLHSLCNDGLRCLQAGIEGETAGCFGFYCCSEPNRPVKPLALGAVGCARTLDDGTQIPLDHLCKDDHVCAKFRARNDRPFGCKSNYCCTDPEVQVKERVIADVGRYQLCNASLQCGSSALDCTHSLPSARCGAKGSLPSCHDQWAMHAHSPMGAHVEVVKSPPNGTSLYNISGLLSDSKTDVGTGTALADCDILRTNDVPNRYVAAHEVAIEFVASVHSHVHVHFPGGDIQASRGFAEWPSRAFWRNDKVPAVDGLVTDAVVYSMGVRAGEVVKLYGNDDVDNANYVVMICPAAIPNSVLGAPHINACRENACCVNSLDDQVELQWHSRSCYQMGHPRDELCGEEMACAIFTSTHGCVGEFCCDYLPPENDHTLGAAAISGIVIGSLVLLVVVLAVLARICWPRCFGSYVNKIRLKKKRSTELTASPICHLQSTPPNLLSNNAPNDVELKVVEPQPKQTVRLSL